MSVFYPALVPSKGADTWIFVPTIASTTAMTVAEATAAGACVLQNAFRPGFGASQEPERITDVRQGSKNVYEVIGTTKVSLSDMVLIDEPQLAPANAGRKHIDTLSSGATGYLINRRGLGSATENWVAVATGQRYVGYPVQVSPQVPLAPGDSGGFERGVSFSITGAVFEGVTV